MFYNKKKFRVFRHEINFILPCTLNFSTFIKIGFFDTKKERKKEIKGGGEQKQLQQNYIIMLRYHKT